MKRGGGLGGKMGGRMGEESMGREILACETVGADIR